MTWEEGEDVHVYDPDEGRWLPGYVMSVGKAPHPSGVEWDVVTVRTNETYEGLPLCIVLAVDDARIKRPGTTPFPPQRGSS